MIDAPSSELREMDQLVAETSPEELQNLFGMLMHGEGEIKRSGNPWIAVEMVVLRMSLAPELVNLAEVLRRLDSAEPPPKPRSVAKSKPRARAVPEVSEQSHAPAGEALPRKSSDRRVPPDSPEGEDQTPSEGFTITKITPHAERYAG